MADAPVRLVIRDERDGRAYSFAEVKIEEDGGLVFRGEDAGKDVEEFLGDEDFEYWLRVKSADKDLVLLHLIKAQFASVHALQKWLAERQIAAEFSCY